MDFCPSGDLFTYAINMDDTNEECVAFLMLQIFSAISHCHSKGVIHGDVKLENILISRYEPFFQHEGEPIDLPILKLSDFSASLVLDGPCCEFTGLRGSPQYMAPEVVAGGPYGTAIDAWSAGVVLFIILSGQMPFSGTTVEAIFSQILEEQVDTESGHWRCISWEAKDFVRKLLTSDPELRMSADAALQHPWIAQLY
eukprot:TRINITY_DN17965_c0_g1_i1.p1 TRINITY_DN17965_c0_g1~~TRINITY_DN17965_c0_g1_i1.p1  ORF type:complete len:198 (+),score=9.92 TRINITY_DN17965_c0_g1_i1:377-970(+)